MNDLGKMFSYLFELVQSMAMQVGNIWDWLSESHLIGFKFLGFNVGITIVPIHLLGAGIGALIVWWIIKALVPGL